MQINRKKIKALLIWLSEAKFVWLTISIIVIGLAISLRPQTPEKVIRLTGLFLQLFGIGTVVWGISETRAFFGQPTIASKTIGWITRFPLRKTKTVNASGSASFGVMSSKARGFVKANAGLNPTIEIRLETLEKNINYIHERISSTEKEMDEDFRKLSNSLKVEEASRHTEDAIILQKLEQTGTGGIHISAIGTALLFVGVILSTASVEIAEWVK